VVVMVVVLRTCHAASSKYPFLSVDADEVFFGDMLVGTTGTSNDRVVTLANRSGVWTSWRVQHVDNDGTPQFTARPKEGRLEPGAWAAASVMLVRWLSASLCLAVAALQVRPVR
jgi:hypothetical protein